ncbi:hypothetical protein TWF694_001341 [Orbilia ellipsospora]|uniref:Uncharacterized protein n=1 Tax=Orbilia ellipsospora TaxID=2528407 RepID=A0AAV9XRB7_9PEZI
MDLDIVISNSKSPYRNSEHSDTSTNGNEDHGFRNHCIHPTEPSINNCNYFLADDTESASESEFDDASTNTSIGDEHLRYRYWGVRHEDKTIDLVSAPYDTDDDDGGAYEPSSDGESIFFNESDSGCSDDEGILSDGASEYEKSEDATSSSGNSDSSDASEPSAPLTPILRPTTPLLTPCSLSVSSAASDASALFEPGLERQESPDTVVSHARRRSYPTFPPVHLRPFHTIRFTSKPFFHELGRTIR